MLKTPAAFTSLIDTPQHVDNPLTFIFHKSQILLRSGDLAVPGEAPPELSLPPERLHPVGLWQGRYCQAAWTDSTEFAPAGFEWHSLRSMFGSVDDEFVGLAGRASQIADWARTHRFCGACGTPMGRAGGERAYKCGACGHTAYPQICPAMMVLIRDGDKVLLAKHTRSPGRLFTALAGFVEAGESVEEAVHREVYEEVGLRVHDLRYFSSQSWPFPNSLMIAYTAEYLDGTIRVDPAEIEEARWFGPDDEWPETPHTISIASALLAANRPVRRGS